MQSHRPGKEPMQNSDLNRVAATTEVLARDIGIGSSTYDMNTMQSVPRVANDQDILSEAGGGDTLNLDG